MNSEHDREDLSGLIDDRARPLGKYPHYRRVGEFVFVSGTSSRRADGSFAGADTDSCGRVRLDIGAQTHAVIGNLREILRHAGRKLDDVVDITTFLVNMDDFVEYNAVYGEYFDYTGPSRTTVAVRALPHPHLLIEMKAIAYRPRVAPEA